MQVALMVEERLVGDGRVRMALFEFVKRLQGSAAIGLITVGLRNQTVVDYTTNLNDLVGGLNRLSLDPDPSSNLTESVLAVAEEIERKRPARPVLVMVAISGGQAGGPSPGHVLTQLRQSGAVMHAVTLAGGEIGGDNPARIADANVREQVLGDGPKQSGGRRHEVPSTGAMAQALQQVASDLLGQYVITYTLPEGVKRDRRLNVSVKRRGVSLRAPSAIPDR